jgi:hypothetical protein
VKVNENKTITIIWTVIIGLMLLLEWVLVAIPHVEGIDVRSTQLAGTAITVATDLNGLINSTTTPVTTYSAAVQGMAGVLPIIVVAFMILATVAGVSYNWTKKKL